MRARILLVIMIISSLAFLFDIALAQGRGGGFWPGNGIDSQDAGDPRVQQRNQQRGQRSGENGAEGDRIGQGPGGMGQIMGMGPESGMMGGRDMGFGMFGPPLTTEELLAFLKEHDTVKAEQFSEMYEKQPDQFKEYIGFVCELYTPAARMMAFDKEAGKLAVKNISLLLDIKKQVAEYEMATDEVAKKKIRAELTESLGKQFDVIVDSQQKEMDIWKERLSRFEGRRSEGFGSTPNQSQQPTIGSPGGPGGPGGPGRGPGVGGRGGRGDRSEEMQQRMKEQFEKRQQDIDKWKQQKKQIVERKLIDMVEDVRPFPWTV